MPELVVPTTAVHASYLEAVAEYLAAGEDIGYPGGVAAEFEALRRAWHTPDGFAAFVAWVRVRALPETPRPAHIVPTLELW